MKLKSDLVLVKLGAVFIVVHALHNLAYYASFIMGSQDYMLIASFVFCTVFAIPALISWVLWRFPATVIGSLYAEPPEESKSDRNSNGTLMIGVSLIGVYTLVFGVIDLVYFEAHRYAEYKLAQDANFPDYPILPETVAGRITNIIQIILGIALIYGRRGLARLLQQVRIAGVDPRQ